MSLPGSGKTAQSNGEGGTLLTVMFVLATLFMLSGVIIMSIKLNQYYGKYLWDW